MALHSTHLIQEEQVGDLSVSMVLPLIQAMQMYKLEAEERRQREERHISAVVPAIPIKREHLVRVVLAGLTVLHVVAAVAAGMVVARVAFVVRVEVQAM